MFDNRGGGRVRVGEFERLDPRVGEGRVGGGGVAGVRHGVREPFLKRASGAHLADVDIGQ